MGRIDKTVFLSYRRTNFPWALAIFQNLTQHGYDVFFDFKGIASGDFEGVIVGNIQSRAHFLVVLTPSALKRCPDPGDWLRREIETALDTRRNIIPLMFEGFDFSSPGIADQLTGTLEPLKRYNALNVPDDYFDEAMDRLRERYLNVSMDAVLHPPSRAARSVAQSQQAAAGAAPRVASNELRAQKYFERGHAAVSDDEILRCFTEAIRLKPDFADAFYWRGFYREVLEKDLEGALQDLDEAIRLKPDTASYWSQRGGVRRVEGDLNEALRDYDEAIRLEPDSVGSWVGRAQVRESAGDLEGALQDFDEAIRLVKSKKLFNWPLQSAIAGSIFLLRAKARKQHGDLVGALEDHAEAIRLSPGLKTTPL